MVAAVGAEVLRDVIMNVGIPKFFSYLTVALAIVAAVVTMLTKEKLQWSRLAWLYDAVRLSVSSVDTGVKAIYMDIIFLKFFLCQ